MHDQVILKQLLDPLSNYDNVIKAVVEVGEISSLTPGHLRESWKKMSDIELEVRVCEAEVSCECGFRGSPRVVERSHDLVLIECPTCKKSPKIIKGDQIILKEIETKES